MAFDPSKHLRKLQGQEYLEVKWRLAWLRDEHADAQIITELVSLDMENYFAVFKATVILPSGASATGYGSESRQDFKDFVEKAETKAVGRALGMLGYGTQFSHDFDEPENGNKPQAQTHAPARIPTPAYRPNVSPNLYQKQAQVQPQAQAQESLSPSEEEEQDSHSEKVRSIRDWARIHPDNVVKIREFLESEKANLLQELPESKLDQLMEQYDITRSPQAS